MSRNRRARLRAVRRSDRPLTPVAAEPTDPLTDPITIGPEPTDGFTYLGKVWTHPFHGVGLLLAQERAEGGHE
jgi:hypothetical protein